MPNQGCDIIFTPGKVGRLEIKNRLIRSATYENAAGTDGEATDALVAFYRRLGQGGVGLIVTGVACVMAGYHAPHHAMRVDHDRLVPGLSKIPAAVHGLNNGARIMLQLHHPGRQIIRAEDQTKILPFMPPALLTHLQRAAQQAAGAAATPSEAPSHPEPVAPSARLDTLFDRVPRALTAEEIEALVEAFAQGIRRAQAAGFDGVQLHAAHGWLLSAFLSPHTNQRADRYGGSTENRTRMVCEILARGRQLVGNDFPILIKINTTDFFNDGTDLAETQRVVRILSAAGIDAIETSGGMWESVTRPKEELGWPPYLLPESRTAIKGEDQEAYFLSGAKAVKAQTHLPVILVGGLRSRRKVANLLASGAVDFISLSRPLIRQPDLPNLWQRGESDKAACISCNACLQVGDTVTHCAQAEKK